MWDVSASYPELNCTIQTNTFFRNALFEVLQRMIGKIGIDI
jgi:hypothetical protein